MLVEMRAVISATDKEVLKSFILIHRFLDRGGTAFCCCTRDQWRCRWRIPLGQCKLARATKESVSFELWGEYEINDEWESSMEPF
jgi:hypothetical protein